MLSLVIFLPVLTGLVVLTIRDPRAARRVALAGALATLALALWLWAAASPDAFGVSWRERAAWIPAIGASYHIAAGGVSLPLIALSSLLCAVALAYTSRDLEKGASHPFLLLLIATGLNGVFAAQDLLLFYLFFEVALVPMYFIVGAWGGPERRYAAMKFFLYTRAGSLAMLLGFLGLYLAAEPRTFSLPALIRAQPLADSPAAATAVFFALLIGFGVKIPLVPLHNWLPDAHVEAPTEGSVVLAGAQLKLGGYGLVAVMLPLLPDAVARWSWLLIGLGLAGMVWGALAALAQDDMKRLIAYTSVNHMGYVALAVGVAAATGDLAVRQLALNGAAVQMVSHGLLTGGMFLMVGMLHHRTGTRDIRAVGGLLGEMPGFAALFALLAFGSLGLPGLSGFIAEFQVISATLSLSLAAAIVAAVALVIVTGLYLRLVAAVLLGPARAPVPALAPLAARELWAVGPLVAGSLAIGIAPMLLLGSIAAATEILARF